MVIDKIKHITERITEKSKASRAKYLDDIAAAYSKGVNRSTLSCGNLAHGFAACNVHDKSELSGDITPNFAIVTAYNDMLSAHKPYEHYPEMIREFSRKYGCVAQVAGGVPAMCDGVTQGQLGMELSLFSRDVIAMSTAVALSHNMFDGAFCLGICDKIVPGLLIGSLKFGHMPVIFLPGGPMPSGLPNEEKAKIREQFAKGEISREELLKGESDSYHSPGTCTFYGTANSNQMLMEVMGLQLPGSSFINPDTDLRTAINEEAIKTLSKLTKNRTLDNSLGYMLNEKTIVNGIIGLLATGGSTNHTIHLIAMAKAAGIQIDWQDFSDLSEIVPLIARVYPNGAADINHFHAAGGMSFVIKTLLENGLLHEDVNTIVGKGLNQYTKEPKLIDGKLTWVDGQQKSLNDKILRPASEPFSDHGGLVILKGNIGRSVIKTSAVPEENLVIEAPAIVFKEQDDIITAFKAGELEKDFVAVVPFQGPSQNGMPELHKLTPTLTVLQKKGYKVALVTDGRMSGASGKIPAAIHLSPEANKGGAIAKLRDGDIIRLDAVKGTLNVLDNAFLQREVSVKDNSQTVGFGRELFKNFRASVSSSEEGASVLF